MMNSQTDVPAEREPTIAQGFSNAWPFLTGYAISAVGDGVWYVALPLLVLQITHSPLWVSAAVALQFLPSVLFALFAGSAADRLNRKVQLCLWPLASAIVCCVIFFSAVGHGIRAAGLLLVLVFVLQACGEFYVAVFFATAPDLFRGDQLVRWNSGVETIRQICFVVAPLLGGLLYAWIGPYAIAGIDGITFGALALAAIGLPNLRRPRAEQHFTLFGDAKKAARWLWHEPSMRDTVLTSFIGNAIVAVMQVGFFIHTKAGLHLSSQIIGLLMSLQALGSIGGALAAPWISRRITPTGRALFIAFAVDAISLILMAIGLSNIYLFGFAIVLAYASGATEAILVISLRQRIIPSDMLGRVFSVVRLAVMLAYAPIALLVGFVSSVYALWPAFWIAALFGVALTAFVRYGAIYREVR